MHPKNIEFKVLDLYNRNLPTKEICKITGVHKDYPTTVAKKHGVSRGSGRKSPIAPELFQLGTPAADYWIGYLISDGNIHISIKSRTHNIRFSTIDQEIVDKFLRYNPYCNLHQQTATLQTLYFGSTIIVKYLISIGITPNKSKTIKLKFPLNNHLLRGIFDGDGNVHNKRAAIKITTGSKALGKQIVSYLKKMGIYSKLRLRCNTTTYDVWIERIEDYKKFYKLLYKDANPEIYMERKFNKFFSYQKQK